MHSNPAQGLRSCLSVLSLWAIVVSRHPINISFSTTTEKQANKSMRKQEAHGLQKAMPHSQTSTHLSTWSLPQIFLDFLTTDGFLTAGSVLVFPWHFSPTSLFICNSRKKKCAEVVRSSEMSFVTLQYFYKDKEPKSTCYADKELWERCICTWDARGGFF